MLVEISGHELRIVAADISALISAGTMYRVI